VVDGNLTLSTCANNGLSANFWSTFTAQGLTVNKIGGLSTGGGISLSNMTSATITRCFFLSNLVSGLSVTGVTNLVISDSSFISNTALSNGAGVKITQGKGNSFFIFLF